STLETFNLQRARYGVLLRQYTPDPSAGFVRNYKDVVRRGFIDNVGFNDGGGILVCDISPLNAGEFGFEIYDNFISRVAFAGISVGGPFVCAGNTDKVSIWNNTIYGSSPFLGGSYPPDGIRVLGSATNLAITNNIVSSLPQDGIDIASATTSNN